MTDLHHVAPDDLDAAGVSLWESVASKYELRPDEQAILSSACSAADMESLLRKAWVEAGTPTTTKGSMGQQVIHPLIGEMRAQRASRDAALARLKLPDLDSAPAVNQNRDAANSSWKPSAARGGRGA